MKLLFVYNADSNFFSPIKGTAHKLVSPESYPCNLCRLTYPFASMDKRWKRFVDSLPYEVSFLHRDEFHKKFPSQKGATLPAVFKEDSLGLSLFVSSEKINQAENIEELIGIVRDSLNKQH